MTETTSETVPQDRAARLQRLNVIATVLHGVQAIAVLVLANDFALPVASYFWNDAPNGRLDPARLEKMFEIPVAWGAAGFLILSALFHGIVSTVGRRGYVSELSRQQNRFRWVEYSLSSTLMIILIAMVVVVIIGVLSAVAIPNFNSARQRAKVGAANASAAALITACELAITNEDDVATDAEIKRLKDAFPTEMGTVTVTTPDTCQVTITEGKNGVATGDGGDFNAFGTKTPAKAS